MIKIKDFSPRLYQETIFYTCINNNTLIIIPTGLGKTFVFLMSAINRLNNYPNSKIVLLGPTKPLVSQYYEVFRKHIEFPEEKMAVFTGKISADKRENLWKESQIIFSTPQGFENDILGSRIDLSDVSLMGFDEAHRAVGDYSYVWIAKKYQELSRFPRILGMTASPGTEMEKIQEVCNNLYISKIEVRSEKDPDVKPYIKSISVKWVEVKLPEELSKIKEFLSRCYESKLTMIKELGIAERTDPRNFTKTQLLAFQSELRLRISEERDPRIFKAISYVAEALKVEHAIDLLETQDVFVLKEYMKKLNEDAQNGKVKAVKNLVIDANFKSAYYLTLLADENGTEHPKLEKLREIIKSFEKKKDFKLIVFTQYRDSNLKIYNELKKFDFVRPVMFVGQAKKKDSGLSQEEQKKVLSLFRDGTYNILVSTSVGEEGIDIPNVDAVISYEAVPSAIRQIQRRGRTGRQSEGKLYVLYTKGTRDEAYRWSAFHKEKRMYSLLDKIRKNVVLNSYKNSNRTISEYSGKTEKESKDNPEFKVKIIADSRERSSPVLKQLIELPVDLEIKQLDLGDFAVSKNNIVEFKNSEDFASSIVDGRLFDQASRLKDRIKSPLFIVQGDIYSVPRMHPNAIRGTVLSLLVDFRMPVLFTKDAKETAYFLYLIANKVQNPKENDFYYRGFRKPVSLKSLQLYVAASLPGVGTALAKPLLKHFGSLKNIADAGIDSFLTLEKFGPKRAKNIHDLFRLKYDEIDETSNKTLLDEINDSMKKEDKNQ